MKTTSIIIGLGILVGCASKQLTTSTNVGSGDTRTKPIEMLNDNTYLLMDYSDDKTYGFDRSNPVKVGGSGESSGPRNERRYLNGLLGPDGEEIKYYRAGSCCAFKTPNGLIDNTGMLDRYRIYWDGGRDTLDVFINMYDKGDLKILNGLTARKKD
jgi:hypothetical protein